ncbi:MAG: nucleotidyltransferase domain-containing protein [Nitrospiraceae bacterium]
MDENSALEPCDTSSERPSREELQAELLEIPEPPDQPQTPPQPGVEKILSAALGYVRGRRGGDLLAVVLVGSAARRTLTRHSDLDLIVLVKGQDEGQEIIRIADRLIEIRYRGYAAVEQELPYAPRLPPLLRKARILYEHEATASKLLEKASHCFRQGPPPLGLHDKIRLKTECWHWLGKADDLRDQPATAQYLLGIFLEDLLQAFFRLGGLWLTSPADMLRFISSRNREVGELLDRFLTAPTLHARLDLGRQLAELVFRDIPSPPRVD